RLDRWREQYNFALILVAHCRKQYGKSWAPTINEIFGSSAYTRGAEIVVYLRRSSDGVSRLHFMKDRDGELPGGKSRKLSFTREHGFRRDLTDTPTPVEESVRELLQAQPWQTKTELMAATNKSQRTIENALGRLGAVSEHRPGSRAHLYALPSQDQDNDDE